MITSLFGQLLDTLDTPAQLVERSILEANIAFMATTPRNQGLGWRSYAGIEH